MAYRPRRCRDRYGRRDTARHFERGSRRARRTVARWPTGRRSRRACARARRPTAARRCGRPRGRAGQRLQRFVRRVAPQILAEPAAGQQQRAPGRVLVREVGGGLPPVVGEDVKVPAGATRSATSGVAIPITAPAASTVTSARLTRRSARVAPHLSWPTTWARPSTSGSRIATSNLCTLRSGASTPSSRLCGLPGEDPVDGSHVAGADRDRADEQAHDQPGA